MTTDADKRIQDLAHALRQHIDTEHVITDPALCRAFSADNSKQQGPVAMVVMAQNEDDVRHTLSLCNQFTIPLVTRGRGTGTTGAAVPLTPSVVVSFQQMNHIIDVDPVNRAMRVQPGVTNADVQRAAAQHNLFWAPDPGSGAYSSVGGNLANNAAGPRAIKYGTCRENTLGLTAITGNGIKITTGTYTTKGVVGYDLTRLIIGSEATLALITEATLLLRPKPLTQRSLRIVFNDVNACAEAITHIMSQAFVPAACEFMDNHALALLKSHSNIQLDANAEAMLLLTLDENIDEAIAHIDKATQSKARLSFDIAKSEHENQQLWEARKALSPALKKIAPKKINEDIVVPISALPELFTGLNTLSQQSTIPIVNFGHAGNGNIHVNLLFDPNNAEQNINALPTLDKVFDLVLQLGGTLSGEHGVGLAKKPYLAKELSEDVIQLMKQIKSQFDPNHILNPGKIFD